MSHSKTRLLAEERLEDTVEAYILWHKAQGPEDEEQVVALQALSEALSPYEREWSAPQDVIRVFIKLRLKGLAPIYEPGGTLRAHLVWHDRGWVCWYDAEPWHPDPRMHLGFGGYNPNARTCTSNNKRLDQLESCVGATDVPAPEIVSECECGATLPETVVYDPVQSRGMSAAQIQKEYPRKMITCSACGSTVMRYASFAHYVAGDW